MDLRHMLIAPDHMDLRHMLCDHRLCLYLYLDRGRRILVGGANKGHIVLIETR
jgi:hypothetical protein